MKSLARSKIGADAKQKKKHGNNNDGDEIANSRSVDWKLVALVMMAASGLLANVGQITNFYFGQSASYTTGRQLHEQQQQDDEDNTVCKSNPYLDALEEPIETVMEKMDDWLDNINVHGTRATSM